MLKKVALRILKKSTELLTFSGVEKSQYKVGHQGKHYLSIHSTFCPYYWEVAIVQTPIRYQHFYYLPQQTLMHVYTGRE